MRQLSFILIALAVVGVYADEPETLVNGIPARIEDFSHCAAIMVANNEYFCGASIIGPRYVLTAGHCVKPIAEDNYLKQTVRIVTGTGYLNTGGQAHRVSRMWYHQSYREHIGAYDIGVIELEKPIQFNSKQQPIRLARTNTIKNEKITVAAWGSSGLRKAVHNDLRQVKSKLMSAEDCKPRHQGFMGIFPTEFCSVPIYGTGTCHGDSGSGVVRESDKTLIGLVSRGRPCAVGSPDVFTSVSSHVMWIEGLTGPLRY